MFFRTKNPKTNSTHLENTLTQPIKIYDVFNRSDVITEGWYPICKSRQIKRGQVKSFVILKQRVAIFRGEDKTLRALDAFCPHMGADLAHGRVTGNNIECYFHRWQFSPKGELMHAPCTLQQPKSVAINSYPVEEKYGFVWVYAGKHAAHCVPSPPGLEGKEVSSVFLGQLDLYAHHHIMMANGIDLQHFATVHQFDIDFSFRIDEKPGNVFDWHLEGELPRQNRLKHRLARWLLGDRFGYVARFAGGSIVTLTYGPKQFWRGRGFQLPPVHLLWGCVPLTTGVSRIFIFMVTSKRHGFIGKLTNALLYMLTAALALVLKDDDEKAIPNIRFQAAHLTKADASVAHLIRLSEQLPISTWTNRREHPQTNA